jgi:hypothetical protein
VRTTLTLDEDLAARLYELAQERRAPFKRVVNDVLRAGLRVNQPDKAAPYRLPTFSTGPIPGVDLTKANSLAAQLDDDETIRKLELRK